MKSHETNRENNEGDQEASDSVDLIDEIDEEEPVFFEEDNEDELFLNIGEETIQNFSEEAEYKY